MIKIPEVIFLLDSIALFLSGVLVGEGSVMKDEFDVAMGTVMAAIFLCRSVLMVIYTNQI